MLRERRGMFSRLVVRHRDRVVGEGSSSTVDLRELASAVDASRPLREASSMQKKMQMRRWSRWSRNTCLTRSTLRVPLAFLAATLLAIPSFALAGSGGKSISSALPIGTGESITTSTDAKAGVEFYSVSLTFGDLLTVGYGVPDAFLSDPLQQNVGVCLLPPGTDDFSLATTPCRGPGFPSSTRSKLQYSHRATQTGVYFLAAGIGACTGVFQGVVYYPCGTIDAGSRSAPPTPYVVRVRIQSPTSVRFTRLPASFRVGTTVLVRGVVTSTHGVPVGVCHVQRYIARTWGTIARGTVGANGTCAMTVRMGRVGREQLRLTFVERAGSDFIGSRAPFRTARVLR